MDLRNMTDAEYGALVKRLSPSSPTAKNGAWAFLVGGGICLLGQLLKTGFLALGLGEESAGTAVSVSLIFLSALATGLNVYDDLAKHAGAGTLVPITGFANSVVSPAMEFKAETVTLGTCAKMFTIAGPVIVYGVTAAALYGAVLVLVQAVLSL